MRGLAYRRQQQRKKYAKRVKQIYETYGGYVIRGGKLIKCTSTKEYINNENPYVLKSQGNFEHHSFFDEKWDKRIQKVKDKQKIKKILKYSTESNLND